MDPLEYLKNQWGGLKRGGVSMYINMQSSFSHKGAIRTLIDPVTKDPGRDPVPLLYELIDNREHSQSKHVRMIIDSSKRSLHMLYSEPGTKDKMQNTVRWFGQNDTMRSNTIGTRGVGSKLTSSYLNSDIYFLRKTNDTNVLYHRSSIDATRIWKDLEKNVSDPDFDRTLSQSTKNVEEFNDEDLKKWEADLFKEYSSFHFVCRHSNIQNSHFIDHVTEEDTLNEIIKKVRTKYYHQLKSRDLILDIMIDKKNYNINTRDRFDTIGYSETKEDELHIDIFLKESAHLGFILRIDNQYFQFKKNGTGVSRDTYVPQERDNFVEPDFTALIYKIPETSVKVLTPEQRKSDIVDNKMEAHLGWYIMINNTFISNKPIRWSITDGRNLPGSSRHRAVLKTNTVNGKQTLGLEGLKDTYDSIHNPSINRLFTQISSSIYKKYCELAIHEREDPKNYVLTTIRNTRTNTSSSTHRDTSQWIYVMDFGKVADSENHLLKFGVTTSPIKRIQSYGDDKETKKRMEEFKTVSGKYNILYLSSGRIRRGLEVEQKIKEEMNEDTEIITTDTQGGCDILEYVKGKPAYIYKKVVDIIHNL